MQELINKSNELLTTSRIISHAFGYEHKEILRVIRIIRCTEDFRRDNFIKSKSKIRGRLFTCYDITKNGAMLLCLGLSSPKAALKKESLINSFDSNSIIEAIAIVSDIDVDIDFDNYIYIAKESCSKRYKIGISKNPEQRIKNLNTGNPEKLTLIHSYKATEEGFKSESIVHALYADKRLNSEWFRKDIDLSLLPP